MNILEARRRILGGEVYKKTAEGNPISVRSLARMRPGLKLFGRSEQFTTTGAQLFDASQIKDGFVSGASIGESFNVSNNQAYPNAQYVEIDVSDIEIISWDLTGCLNGFSALRIRYFDADGMSVRNGSTAVESGTVDVYDVDKIYVMALEAFNEIAESKAMVNSGNKILPWEPYTGGKPSPNPDYPQEIASAGDDGSIDVDVLGGNLFDVSKASVISDVPYNLSCEIEGDYIHLHGTSTASNKQFQFRLLNYPDGYTGVRMSLKEVEKQNISSASIRFEETTYHIVFNITVTTMGSPMSLRAKIMINRGTEALPWEPYKQPQSLTVQTPNGLPGIPVNSGGNYTDENGQQWICDEIDFKRGKYVKRVQLLRITDFSTASEPLHTDLGNTESNIQIPEYHPDIQNIKYSLCDSFIYSTIGDYVRFAIGSEIKLRVYFTLQGVLSKEDFIAKMEEISPTILFPIAAPIETDLSQEQLSAYANLHTNRPTTVVSATDDVGIKLTYKTKKSLEVT